MNADPTPKTTQKTMSKTGEEMIFVPLSSVMSVTAAAAMPEMRSEIFFPSMIVVPPRLAAENGRKSILDRFEGFRAF